MTALGTGPIRRQLIEILTFVGEHGIDADDLQQQVYGTTGRAERVALHVALHHLRRARPDLAITKRYVYRLNGRRSP